MHPSFSQSVAYMVCKQAQCVSDIIDAAPANHFPMSSDMGSSDIVGVLVPKATWSMGDMDLPSNAI